MECKNGEQNQNQQEKQKCGRPYLSQPKLETIKVGTLSHQEKTDDLKS